MTTPHTKVPECRLYENHCFWIISIYIPNEEDLYNQCEQCSSYTVLLFDALSIFSYKFSIFITTYISITEYHHKIINLINIKTRCYITQ